MLNPFGAVQTGTPFIICDAGETVVKVTAYVINSLGEGRDSIVIEQSRLTSCKYPFDDVCRHTLASMKYMFLGLNTGSKDVDARLSTYLCERLRSHEGFPDANSQFIDELVSEGLSDFRLYTKRNFSSNKDIFRVRLGGQSMVKDSLMINRGAMIIPRCVVRALFSACALRLGLV